MATTSKFGRIVFPWTLRKYFLTPSRVRQGTRRLFVAFALASAALLLSFGAAQAQNATTTQLISGPSPSVAGEPVTFTATVVPATPGSQTPTGTVTFFDGGAQIGTGTLTANGTDSVATFLTQTLAVGSHTITTRYPGDANFSGSSGGPLMQNVNKNSTTTQIFPSPNPSTSGQAVGFDIVVVPVTPSPIVEPTGTVTVFDNGNQIGTVNLTTHGSNSSGTFITSTLTVGSHTITTSYPGDVNFNGSNGSIRQLASRVAPGSPRHRIPARLDSR